MTAEFARAQLLREHGRHPEAVAMLHSHLAHHPDDPGAYIELALNRMEIPGELANALDSARKAAGLSPDDPFPLALMSRILGRLDRHKEALATAENAIRLDPDFDFSWVSKCIALIDLTRWKEAEEAARHALSLDADNEAASNLLAHVLRMQNRLNESEEESRRRLERNPENAFSFANAGWAALQRGRVAEAEGHFKESLRLDPQMEYARQGLKQSYRARSAFFRVFLKWSFFMQRFSEKNRFLIILGLIFGFKILRILFAAVNPLLVIPLAFVYYLFLFGTWISTGLANFFLLSDSSARLSLDRGEKAEGLAVGGLFFGGIITGVAGLLLSSHGTAASGGVMMVAAIPASMVFTNPSIPGRAVFGTILSSILACGVVMAVDIAMHPQRPWSDGIAGACLGLVVLLALGCTWLGAVSALRTRKEQ